MRKKTPKEIEQEYLKERKDKVNAEWDKYLTNLNASNVDRDKLILLMDEMNSVDRMIIRHKRRDLLN